MALIEVVTGRNALLYEDALGDGRRLCHGSPGEGMARETSCSLDGLQEDRLDPGETIYLLLTRDDGTVIGAHRLLPAGALHPVPGLVFGWQAANGVRREKTLVLDCTCVDETSGDTASVETARKHLMVGLFEFCLRAGFDRVMLAMPANLLFRGLVVGLDIAPLGSPFVIDGGWRIAVIVRTDRSAYEAMCMAFGVVEPQVHYVGARPGDRLTLVPLQALTLLAAE